MALPVTPSNEIYNRFKDIADSVDKDQATINAFMEHLYRGIPANTQLRERIAEIAFRKLKEKFQQDYFSEEEFLIE